MNPLNKLQNALVYIIVFELELVNLDKLYSNKNLTKLSDWLNNRF